MKHICVHCGSEIATAGIAAEALVNCPQCQQPLTIADSTTGSQVDAGESAGATSIVESAPASDDFLTCQAEKPVASPGPGQFPSIETETGEPSLAPWSGQSNEARSLHDESLRLPQQVIPTGMRGGLFIALVFVPLVSYAILATIAVVILYTRPPPPDPLERLPDLEGDFKGTQHQTKNQVSYDRVSPESDLPAHLRVPLGKTIRVGDVEVSPLTVKLCRITYRQPGVAPEKSDGKTLAMTLQYRNVSPDCVFSPTDPYFDRRWRTGSSGKPYGFLEIGEKRYFGGALAWQPGQPANRRETIDGQCYFSLLPGEEMQSMICTNPEPDLLEILSSYSGPLLWRVQVRRGLVSVAKREVSTTAVIGVLFASSDVLR